MVNTKEEKAMKLNIKCQFLEFTCISIIMCIMKYTQNKH